MPKGRGDAGKKRGARGVWVWQMQTFTFIHLEWINNKILMYGTGNYIQYPVIMEKTIKEELYMYITESLCYITDIGTTL